MCDVFGPPTYTRPFQQYQVYKKRNAILVFGIDKIAREYSVLRIPKKDDHNAELELLDGEERFPLSQLDGQLRELRSIDGGVEKIATASGIIGFVRFLQGYYLLLITKHKKVGKIGHHYVLSIEKTLLLPLFVESAKLFRDEKAFRDQLNTLNLSKDFYFSYSYELSRTAQQNLADAMHAIRTGDTRRPLLLEQDPDKHHRFVWNHYHMGPFLRKNGWQHWCLTVIHGFFAYTKCSSFGWTFEIALIARRSRFYAGTRYRKRGLNVDGHVANDVETEQLLCDDCTRHLFRGHVMSFVQIRGSVPLFWSQEATAINPKPPVVYPRCDTTLSATRLHFKDLLERYGTPQLVVNLMRAKKVDSYEVRLKQHFESAIERVNRELPPAIRILYRPFDMKSHSKSSHIYEVFARLAESVVARVGFFHTSQGVRGAAERVQNGMVRTNCVDCLDRTNVLQFFVGLEVLKQQLTALNLLPEPRLDFDSQVVFVLSELYDIMGDHLALQYAGSVAHKKYQLLGSRPRMMTSSKELLTSIHRHYNNSFTDSEKQASTNLFLGTYQPREHPRPWDLDCDSWLHHRSLRDDYDPGAWWEEPLSVYADKMAPLRSQVAPVSPSPSPRLKSEENRQWFKEVHRTWKMTCFEKLLSRLEATFVQINASTRRLATSRPFKAIVPRHELTQNALAFADSDSLSLPRTVDAADELVYKAYADPRHLSRLIWKSDPADHGFRMPDVVCASFPLARQAEPPSLGILIDVSEQQFRQWFVQRSLHRTPKRATISASALRGVASSVQVMRRSSLRPPIRLRLCSYCNAAHDICISQTEVPVGPTVTLNAPDMNGESDQGVAATGGSVPSTATAAGAAAGSAAGGDGHPHPILAQAPRTRQLSPPPPSMQRQPSPSMQRQPSPATQRPISRAGSHEQPLCPRHFRRAVELQNFVQQSSLDAPAVGDKPRERRHNGIMVSIPERNSRGRPWEGWLRQAPTKKALSTRRPSKQRKSSKSVRTAVPETAHSQQSQQGENLPARLSTSRAAVDARSSGPAATSGDGVVWAGTGASGLAGDGRSPGMSDQQPAGASGFDTQVSGGLSQPSGELALFQGRSRHLWSYAFPYCAPSAPDVSDLGLPAWWLETQCPSSGQETQDDMAPVTAPRGSPGGTGRTDDQPVLHRRSEREERRLRNRRASMHGVGGAVRQTTSPDKSFAREPPPREQLFAPPPRGGRSIFTGLGPKKVLDEIVEAELGGLELPPASAGS